MFRAHLPRQRIKIVNNDIEDENWRVQRNEEFGVIDDSLFLEGLKNINLYFQLDRKINVFPFALINETHL